MSEENTNYVAICKCKAVSGDNPECTMHNPPGVTMTVSGSPSIPEPVLGEDEYTRAITYLKDEYPLDASVVENYVGELHARHDITFAALKWANDALREFTGCDDVEDAINSLDGLTLGRLQVELEEARKDKERVLGLIKGLRQVRDRGCGRVLYVGEGISIAACCCGTFRNPKNTMPSLWCKDCAAKEQSLIVQLCGEVPL